MCFWENMFPCNVWARAPLLWNHMKPRLCRGTHCTGTCRASEHICNVTKKQPRNPKHFWAKNAFWGTKCVFEKSEFLRKSEQASGVKMRFWENLINNKNQLRPHELNYGTMLMISGSSANSHKYTRRQIPDPWRLRQANGRWKAMKHHACTKKVKFIETIKKTFMQWNHNVSAPFSSIFSG